MKLRSVAAAISGLLVFLPGILAAEALAPCGVADKIGAAAPAAARVKPARKRALLVFTLTRGFHHDSIPCAARAIELMGNKTQAYRTVVSDDIAMFEPDKIRQFDAVVLDNVTGELFLPPDVDKLPAGKQKEARERDEALKESFADFVRNGGGLVGIHAATDAFYQWPEFGEMMGGYFAGHPWNGKVGVALDDPGHPLCAAFQGKGFEIRDEIYQFREPYSRESLHVLLKLDRAGTSEKGDRPDNDYALSWIKTYGKGRVFYCAFGHYDEVFQDPAILRFCLDGIQFALGDLAVDARPSGQVGPVDPFMGEYSGKCSAGMAASAAADAEGKVIAEGGGRYRAVLTAGADIVELKGSMEGKKVVLGMPTDEGCMTNWSVAGPYRQKGKGGQDLFDIVFPPENPSAQGVEWRQLKMDPAKRCVADLARAGGQDCVGYLKATVESPIEQEADLLLGSDDGIKAWLNGKLVHANNVMRGLEPGQDQVRVKLTKGENVLLLKITQGGGDWAAWAALNPRGKGKLKGVLEPAKGREAWTGAIAEGELKASSGASSFALKYAARKSPTEGLKPPKDAIVLLPFTGGPPSLEEWDNPTWIPQPDGSVRVGRGDARTRRQFGDIKLHAEFRVPFMPNERGQGRGNSGVYLEDRYEVQVLDSFGLPTAPNECGAIYTVAAPKVNASLPPLVWQTYDITFQAPRFNPDGSVAHPAFLTVLHNGVLVHDKVEVPHPTGGGADGAVKAGPIKLQDHGNPMRYRNIWVVELKDN